MLPLPNMFKCANGGIPYMNKYDAEKISTNLIFLETETVNTGILIEKLVDSNLLDDNDRIRISQVPDYNQNLEVYLAVLRKGPLAFEILLQCLSQTGNEVIVERLNPQTDFQVIWLQCRQHWPFTSIMLISQTCGCLYWMYRFYNFVTSTSPGH